jgi:hypothetical protein
METQDIKNIGLAYLQVLEAMKKKKMDKVDADELKGSHADRDDKDIDNDGDADKSDEYLHNRRKAIKAAITKEEVEFDEAQIMLEGAIDLAKRIIKRGVGTVTGARAKAHAELADMIRHKKVSNMFSMGINKADKKGHAAQMKKSENEIRAHIKKHDLGPLTKKPGEVTAQRESVDEANKSVKEQLDHSHAKQVANSIAKSNKNLKVTSSGSGEHFVHHKDDPEGESGHVSVKAAGGQLHVSHEMGQAHGNKKFNDTSSAVAHGVRVSSGGVSEAVSPSGVLDHSHAKQVANSIAKSNKNLKVTSSGNRHFVHHKDDPEGESGHVSVHSSNGQLHVSHEMGQAHGNKKFNDTSSAVAHGVRVSSGGVSEAWSVSEAKKMSISGKQIKAALASAKAQAKPKDQVSLKKAPFDIPKESVEVERNWTILNRIQEKAIAPRDMNHVKGATPPETMDSKASPKAKEFAATSGVPATVTLDANVVAQQTAAAIRASAAKIGGNSNRPNDQKTGDKNIIKSTVAESKAFTKFRSFFS